MVYMDKDTEQLSIVFNRNVLISSSNSLVLESGNHMVMKTGKEKSGGLLFLNPNIEDDNGDVSDIIRCSHADYERNLKSMENDNIKRDD